MYPEQTIWLIIIIFILVAIAVGRVPMLRMNRATISLVGATTLIATGAISLPAALAAVDLNTIVLLLSMMVINANLRLSGFFRLVAAWSSRYAHSPASLLAWTIGMAGIFSAIFMNDTIVLILTPLVIEVTVAIGLSPIPFLIALATAANIGSVATLIGNPQNMLIGMASGISFGHFFYALAPVAGVGLIFCWVIIRIVFYRQLSPCNLKIVPQKVRIFRPLLVKSIVASLILMVLLLIDVAIPLASLMAASLLLVTRRIRPERVFQEIDWSLLVFFSGLFVVTHALVTAGFSQGVIVLFAPWVEHSVALLTVVGALVSNLISNVPAVLLLKPVIMQSDQPHNAWLTLAMASTLAGNMTLLGSVANLIVAELARREKVYLSFLSYLIAGLPITLLSLAWGVWWLQYLFGR